MDKNIVDVVVIGLGYIGLPTACIIAKAGKRVCGVDVSVETVNSLRSGLCQIEEPGLQGLFQEVLHQNLSIESECRTGSTYIIAVPTPVVTDSDTSRNVPNMASVYNALEQITPLLKAGDLVILESTSPVGSIAGMVGALKLARMDLFDNQDVPLVHFAYCPERVIPGNTLKELVDNDRVIGGYTAACSKKAKVFYESFVNGDCIMTDAKTAEMTKLVENSCRDSQLAFVNELSMLCDKLNVDVNELIQLANRHPRINLLNPGPGVGGHCIAVDPWFLIYNNELETPFMQVARQVNNQKEEWTIEKITQILKEMQSDRLICFGLSFKPDVDDFRNSPALNIFKQLSHKYPDQVYGTDPFAFKIQSQISNVIDIEEVNYETDTIVILVPHSCYRSLEAFRAAAYNFAS